MVRLRTQSQVLAGDGTSMVTHVEPQAPPMVIVVMHTESQVLPATGVVRRTCALGCPHQVQLSTHEPQLLPKAGIAVHGQGYELPTGINIEYVY